MTRKMHFKTRASHEFTSAVVESYAVTQSCTATARRISIKFGFQVSPEYVGRILHKKGIRIKKIGRACYSIYDAQLKPLLPHYPHQAEQSTQT